MKRSQWDRRVIDDDANLRVWERGAGKYCKSKEAVNDVVKEKEREESNLGIARSSQKARAETQRTIYSLGCDR